MIESYKSQKFGSDNACSISAVDDNINEVWIINKVLSLINGYDSRPLFVQISHKDLKFNIGYVPNIFKIAQFITLPNVSHIAVDALLYNFVKFGTSLHLLYKLQNSIDNNQNKVGKLPKSLRLLLIHVPDDLTSNDARRSRSRPILSKISLDWGFDNHMPTFYDGLKSLLNDWRRIMFDINRNIVSIWNNTEDSISSVYVDDTIITPIMELYNENIRLFTLVTSSRDHLNLLSLYIILEPFMKIINSLVNFIELFLNKLDTNDKTKCNFLMIEHLIIFSRDAEITRDIPLMKLWKYFLYCTLIGTKDSIIESSSIISSSLMFNIKNSSDLINCLSFTNISINTSLNYLTSHNLNTICDYNTEGTEILLLMELDKQLNLENNKKLTKIKEIINNDLYYYLMIFNHLIFLNLINY